MTSSKIYWQQREAEALKHYLTEEKEYQKRINDIYDRMLDDIQKEIDSFYARYADKEGITLAEAKKRVKTADIKEFERKAKRYVKEKNFSKRANEEMRLYNLMMKVNRLEMLKANIGLKLISNFDELNQFMEEILQDRTEEELERQAGILGNTIQNNAELAHMIVNASFHNATFSDRIWLYQDLMRDELGKLLEKGLIQGKNPRVLARELNKVFNTGKYNCERLMRTELARVQIEAQRQSYIKNGNTMYTFIANSDCCDVCKAINDKHFYVKDMLSGTNAPPMHPNCRCSTAPYSDRKAFDEWLDFVSNGGTTEEWEKLKKGKKAVVKQPIKTKKSVSSSFKPAKTVVKTSKTNKINTTDITDNNIKAIHDYMSAKSYVVNDKLRNNSELSDNEQEFIKELDTALEKLPKYNGNLQRSLYFNSDDDIIEFLKDYTIGEPVTYKEYISTTKGETYNPDGQVQIYIKDAKNGVDISSYNKAEDEVLYDRDSTFKVSNIVEKDGKHYILLEEKEDE